MPLGRGGVGGDGGGGEEKHRQINTNKPVRNDLHNVV